MSYSDSKWTYATGRNRSHFLSLRTSKLRQDGLTLIEVLITLLVLSIGLVGIAALHLSSMRFAHSSYYTSLASTVALDLEERLWIELGRDTTATVRCLDASSASNVVSQLQARWRAGTALQGSQPVIIPDVLVTAGTISTSSGVNSWTDVPIQISWVDERFEGAGNEVFAYRARVVCFDPDFGT